VSYNSRGYGDAIHPSLCYVGYGHFKSLSRSPLVDLAAYKYTIFCDIVLTCKAHFFLLKWSLSAGVSLCFVGLIVLEELEDGMVQIPQTSRSKHHPAFINLCV